MSRILGYLVAFYALWLSSCLAPLCAASGQLLIQGMLTEASCQLTTRHHPRLAIPLPNSRDNVSQDSHLVAFQLRLSDCGNTLAKQPAVDVYIEPLSTIQAVTQARRSPLELVLLDQQRHPVHTAHANQPHPLQQESVIAGSNNQPINLVAQYPSATHPNGRVHLAYLTLAYH